MSWTCKIGKMEGYDEHQVCGNIAATLHNGVPVCAECLARVVHPQEERKRKCEGMAFQVNGAGERLKPTRIVDPESEVPTGSVFSPYRHQHCGGGVRLVRVSQVASVLSCPSCGLRERVPSGLKTFAQIKAHFDYQY